MGFGALRALFGAWHALPGSRKERVFVHSGADAAAGPRPRRARAFGSRCGDGARRHVDGHGFAQALRHARVPDRRDGGRADAPVPPGGRNAHAGGGRGGAHRARRADGQRYGAPVRAGGRAQSRRDRPAPRGTVRRLRALRLSAAQLAGGEDGTLFAYGSIPARAGGALRADGGAFRRTGRAVSGDHARQPIADGCGYGAGDAPDRHRACADRLRHAPEPDSLCAAPGPSQAAHRTARAVCRAGGAAGPVLPADGQRAGHGPRVSDDAHP